MIVIFNGVYVVGRIRELCEIHTTLENSAIEELEYIANQLQKIADLNGTDIFIDCLITGHDDHAIVVAQAKPNTATSLYSQIIVGQVILKDNEPGVFHSFFNGNYVKGTRAITNDNVTTEQKILPIIHKNRIIAVLIMEQDISNQVSQERTVQLFRQTAEHLGETLWEIMVAEVNLPTLIHEGVILCNSKFYISYINPTAREWFRQLSSTPPEMGNPINSLFSGALEELLLGAQIRGVEAHELTVDNKVLHVKAIAIYRAERFMGGLLLLSDVSDLRQKEKQLMIKSAVIKEIHHRVKNNLQTISSLLRLQMRRTDSSEFQRVLQDSIHRIKTIALVHETLSRDNIDSVELIEMIERIVSMLMQTSSLDTQQIYYTVHGEPIMLSSEKATPVALVVNELVQNSIDHAFIGREAGLIDIYAWLRDGNVHITVQDDGVGWDGNLLVENTLGVRIVRTLAQEELEGVINFDNHVGTVVTLIFPTR